MPTTRSYLFAPATRPDLLTKADRGPADAVVADLEDAVPLARKGGARDAVVGWLASDPVSPVWVRVNSGALLTEDLRALRPVRHRVAGVLLAKAGDPAAVAEAAALGRPLGLFLETADAVLRAAELARLPGVVALHLGEYDLAAEVGVDLADPGTSLAFARAQVVFACAAAGLAPPPAPVSTVVDDPVGYLASTRQTARQGFFGRVCIHPRQVGLVHEAFAPAAGAVAAARELLGRYEKSLADGAGVFLDQDGRMVDEAVVRSARRVLATVREVDDGSSRGRRPAAPDR